MNIIVEEIGAILKASPEPMTYEQIAKKTERRVTKQTIFNNMAEAINRGFAVDTGKTINRAKLFASPDSLSNEYCIPWGDKRMPLKTLFLEWLDYPPREPINAIFARQVINLFSVASGNADDTTNEDKSFSDKIVELKEMYAALATFARRLDAISKSAHTLLNTEELWHPTRLVDKLIIENGMTTPREIRNALDNRRTNDPKSKS